MIFVRLWLTDDVARLHVKIHNLNGILVGFCFIRYIDSKISNTIILTFRTVLVTWKHQIKPLSQNISIILAAVYWVELQLCCTFYLHYRTQYVIRWDLDLQRTKWSYYEKTKEVLNLYWFWASRVFSCILYFPCNSVQRCILDVAYIK
jgi:hypothetical protein